MSHFESSHLQAGMGAQSFHYLRAPLNQGLEIQVLSPKHHSFVLWQSELPLSHPIFQLAR